MTATADEGISVQAGQKKKRGRPRNPNSKSGYARGLGMSRAKLYRYVPIIAMREDDPALIAAIKETAIFNNQAALLRIAAADPDKRWQAFEIEKAKRRPPSVMRGVSKKALLAERRSLRERLDRNDFADAAAREEAARRCNELIMTLFPRRRREWGAADLGEMLSKEIVDDETLLKIASLLETCDPKKAAAELRRRIASDDKAIGHRNLLSGIKGELTTLSYDELMIVDSAIGEALLEIDDTRFFEDEQAAAEQPPAAAE
jgi:hypothetical protein